MAGSVASLFGPSAEQIVYERQKEERERNDLNFYRGLQAIDVPGVATGMVAGRGIGQGLTQAAQGLFGESQELEDPRIAKALQVRKAFEGFTAADLKDADKLEAVAETLASQGNLEAAMQLNAMASTARAASQQTLSRTGVMFEYEGQLIRGGYTDTGQAVGIDDQGRQFIIPGGATEVKEGDLATPDAFEVGIGEDFADELGLSDMEAATLMAEAKGVQAMPGNQRLDYPTALKIAYLRKGLVDTTNTQSLGLSRTAAEGETAYLQPNGNGEFRVVIAGPDGEIRVEGKYLTAQQVARFTKRVGGPKKRSMESSGVGGYGQGLAREPEGQDILTEGNVFF
jgi:hypothetical protein